MLPTEHLLQKTLDSTFINSRNNTILNETDRIDMCCRSFYKCNSYKQIELNQTTVWAIRHCDCVRSFQICLKNLNTTLSNELNFIHSINTTKCFSKDHPIDKCITFEKYPDAMVQLFKFINSDDREKYLKRCTKYELDRNREKKLQIFDIPFNEYAMLSAGINVDHLMKYNEIKKLQKNCAIYAW